MNQKITEINVNTNYLYRHLKALIKYQATQNRSTQIQFGSNSLTNNDRLNAESDLNSNQDDKELWFNYKRYYGRVY